MKTITRKLYLYGHGKEYTVTTTDNMEKAGWTPQMTEHVKAMDAMERAAERTRHWSPPDIPEDGWECARRIASWMDTGQLQDKAKEQIDKAQQTYIDSQSKRMNPAPRD